MRSQRFIEKMDEKHTIAFNFHPKTLAEKNRKMALVQMLEPFAELRYSNDRNSVIPYN